MIRPVLLLALLLPLLAGCESPEREPREQDKALQQTIEAPQQKARDVERQVLEAQKRTDEALERQD